MVPANKELLAGRVPANNLFQNENESMEFVEMGERDRTPHPNFFVIHFGSIHNCIKI
jgi:hypothetical protein